jgi:tRNA(fMet)-specific endonuclease VapC
MPAGYSLDTSVCVALLRLPEGRIPNQLEQIGARAINISSIVLGELEVGARKSRRPEWHTGLVEAFLELVPVVDFDRAAARHYGEIRAHLERRGTPIGPLDQLIAAHARSLDRTLLTMNLREFRRVPGLTCHAWTRVQ